MEQTYILIPGTQQFKPDQRAESGERDEERRGGSQVLVTTSQQYRFLRDCLVRREETYQELGRTTRRMRHFLFLMFLSFIAFVGSAPGGSVDLSSSDATTPVGNAALGGDSTGKPVINNLAQSAAVLEGQFSGIQVSITRAHVGALAPFLFCYLMLLMSRRTNTRLRIKSEILVIDGVLRRFGCPTSHALMEAFTKFGSPNSPMSAGLFLYSVEKKAYDIYLGFAAIVTFGLSFYISHDYREQLASDSPWIADLLVVATVGSYLVATVAVLAKSPAEKAKTKITQEFIGSGHFETLLSSASNGQRGSGAEQANS